jgi:hypothetical protein
MTPPTAADDGRCVSRQLMGRQPVELGIRGVADAVEIGRGGFAVVYRAYQPAFDRFVAVKVLDMGAADGAALAAFERECRAIGKLSGHPNILTVHESGLTAGGKPYLVMALAAESLEDRLRESGPIGWRDAARIGEKVAGALDFAHQAGILHRDIKPANILMSADGEPQLADFGIARMSDATRHSRSGLALTPAHAPPELLEGLAPTSAVDIYSLASTIFNLVAGHPPFVEDRDESLFVVLDRVAHAPVPDLRPRGVPDSVCKVIEGAMAKAPGDRPPSAAAFASRLRAAAAEGSPESAQGPSSVSPAGGHETEGGVAIGPGAGVARRRKPSGSSSRTAAHRRVVLAIGAGIMVLSGSIAWLVRGPAGNQMPTTTTVAGDRLPTVTFQDDFSDASGGWPKDTAAAYSAGAYRLRLPDGPSRRIAAAPEQNAMVTALTLPDANTRLEVDLRFAPPGTSGGAGLFCRSQPESRDRYQAVILAGGGWEITKEGIDDPTTKLATGPSIPPGIGGGHRVRFECRSAGGATLLRLEVGGTLIGEAVDPNGLRGGTFGVVATTSRAPGVEVVFDNFLVSDL